MTFNDAAPKVVPTLSGHIKFAMQTFQKFGAPRPTCIAMALPIYNSLREELLIDEDTPLPILHGLPILIDDACPGIEFR